MVNRGTEEIARDVEAMATIYVEACERLARRQAQHECEPDRHDLYTRYQWAWIARDNVWSFFLARLNNLRDEGLEVVADNILATARDNAILAEATAFRSVLDTMKGAA